MFADFDFGNNILSKYIDFDENYLKEDLIQIVYKNGYTIDTGWYNGIFRTFIVYDKKTVYEYTCKTIDELKIQLKDAVEKARIKKLDEKFFHRDCLEVAPELVGKILVRKNEDGEEIRIRITETEAYRGTEDKACHASKGRTPRTELLYRESGIIYVYLCYGIHWLMNVITGEKEQPQGVLLRAGENFNGPAKLTKKLNVDKSFNGQSFVNNENIWIEDDGYRPEIKTDKRVGIDYAGKEWADKQWRFIEK